MMICRRSRIVNVAMYKRNNRYTRQFMFFDNACVKTSAYQIVALTFEHVLTFLLTVLDHIYDFSLIISSYIISLFCF